jgi:hypothetical protein
MLKNKNDITLIYKVICPFFIMLLKLCPRVDPIISQVMGWVEWLGLPGSIRFFYYAKSKNNIILIKKINGKKKINECWHDFPITNCLTKK